MRNISNIKRLLGLSLVELMIALVLGLVVVGGVIGVFIANQTTFRMNEASGSIQEKVRTAFQLMSEDLRLAGYTGCNERATRVGLAVPASFWTTWPEPGNGITGFANGANPGLTNAPLAGSDAIHAVFGSNVMATVAQHNPAAPASFVTNDVVGFLPGDLVIACEPYSTVHTAIFNIAAEAAGGVGGVVSYAGALGLNGVPMTFLPGASLTQLNSVVWYVALNNEGNPSLFRESVIAGVPVAEEIADNISDLQLRYSGPGIALTDAPTAAQWPQINVVEITLQLSALDGLDLAVENRTFRYVINIRNRYA
ncbi:hypothetical protein [Rheinheimera sp.]|uniref:hypothetical protein n=1 Tax=Rheinheimera sp. TaxID=1869214 RepID=UPI002735076E|nr:hypothetical protein [Rheinheimera sp.]MDP2716343.1 hypothetical protein [Rheinheimera sp.]